MKKSGEIVNLPLMGIREGKEIGKVCELIIDSQSKKVRYLVIDLGEGCLGFKVIDLADITGIGTDYVTAKTLEDVETLWDCYDTVKELSFSSRYLGGARVISCEGNFIGTVKEFSIDTETGDIINIELNESKNGSPNLLGEKIVALAKNQVFVDTTEKPKTAAQKPVTQEFIAKVEEQPESIKQTENTIRPESTVRPEKTNTIRSESTNTIRPENKTESKSVQPTRKERENQFEMEQRQYLLNRKVSANVLDPKGNIIVKKGDTVTNEIIDMAKSMDILMDLTLNVD